jgi:hypothetical protein
MRDGRLRALLGTRATHLPLLFLGSVATGLICGVHGQPIYGDAAWFLYASQAAHRGEPIYSALSYGYTPYGPLVGAAAIAGAQAFAVPSYIAPRYLNLLAHALCPCVLYLVSMHVWPRSSVRGFLSAATLTGFGLQTVLAVDRLNPKTWLTLCSLLCVLFVLRGRWTLAGCAAAAAALFWQPGAVCVAAAGLLVPARAGADWRRAAVRYTAGVLLGAAPFVAYLAVTGEWHAFWLSAVRGHLEAVGHTRGAARYVRWLAMPIYFWSEFPVFVVAAIAFIAYHARAIRDGGPMAVVARSPVAVLTTFTCAYLAVAVVDFDGSGDAGPLLPFIAWWAVVYAPNAFAKVEGLLARALPSRAPWHCVSHNGALALALVALFIDMPLYAPRFTLAEQRAFLQRVTGDGQVDFLAISAPEFYVLTERPSPIPYIVFYPRIDWLAESRGLGRFVANVADELKPIVIVLRQRLAGSTLHAVLADRIFRGLPSTAHQLARPYYSAREAFTGVDGVREYTVYRLTPDAILTERRRIDSERVQHAP